MPFNQKIQMLFMVGNLNIIEVLTKHLFDLKFYQVEIFLFWYERDIWILKLLNKGWKIWNIFQNCKDVCENHGVTKNAVSTRLEIKERFCQAWKSQVQTLYEKKYVLVGMRTLAKRYFNGFLQKNSKYTQWWSFAKETILGFCRVDRPTWFHKFRLLNIQR